ncbi:uncharacterized protein LOC116802224 [Drosophila sechellia]|uniref:uncharacterized protein LOC116802224 n=1 Tax=Drosophila sechellia TaxID=7238 RepID=UPI0013DE6C16|nr:uncharacterized protein LOC116802224 [Drosophila sechellia]
MNLSLNYLYLELTLATLHFANSASGARNKKDKFVQKKHKYQLATKKWLNQTIDSGNSALFYSASHNTWYANYFRLKSNVEFLSDNSSPKIFCFQDYYRMFHVLLEKQVPTILITAHNPYHWQRC